jgi:hypothetical protein
MWTGWDPVLSCTGARHLAVKARCNDCSGVQEIVVRVKSGDTPKDGMDSEGVLVEAAL